MIKFADKNTIYINTPRFLFPFSQNIELTKSLSYSLQGKNTENINSGNHKLKKKLSFEKKLLEKMVLWKRLNTETPQHGNASKKQTHKTNLMSSSLIKKKIFYQLFYH